MSNQRVVLMPGNGGDGLRSLPASKSRNGIAAPATALLMALGLIGLMTAKATAGTIDYEGPCTLSVTTVTCTGTEAEGGVDIGDIGVTQLDVNTVTADIAPPDGVDGIVFDTSGPASANIQLGTYSILTKGEGADGVYMSTWGSSETADLILSGHVESLGGRGVFINGSGAVTSSTTGNISSAADALTVKSWGGSVEVDHVDGNITSWEGQGVYVVGTGSDIDITGDIDSLGDSVYSHSWGEGSTVVDITGKVTSREGSGLVVDESNTAVDTVNHADTANVTVDGAIDVHDNGISVKAMDGITIDHKGTLDAHTGFGIYANSAYGDVSIIQENGALRAQTDGIVAEAHGDAANITITSSAITAYEGRGVVAGTAGGNVTLTLDGVTAKGDAIDAEANGVPAVGIDIDSNADIVSYEGRGIYASVAGGLGGITVGDKTFAIRIDQDGGITAKEDALTALTINGNVYADVDGNVRSDEGKGINARTYSGLLDIDADNVTAKLDAISAEASGIVTVDTQAVTSYAGRGVYAKSSSSTATINVGAVEAKLDAIDVQATSNASATAGNVTSYDGKGVTVKSAGGTATVDVGNVTSKLDAVHAEATGGITLGADDVVSYDGAGVYAKTEGGSVGVTVGDVTSKLDAIYADGKDGVSVTANDVTSYDGAGVYAKTVGNSGTINVGSVTSQLDAIHVEAPNNISVTADDVTSYEGAGVYGANIGGTTTFNLGSVTSELDAIYAYAYSSAEVTAGDITSYEGIGVTASSKWSWASITAGAVTTENDAVFAQGGSGSATVNVGTVESRNGFGIYATGTNGSASSTSGGVTSLNDAVTVVSDTSSASVIATGDILSHTGKGVLADGGKGAATVTVKGVTSKLDAIYANGKGGSGSASVTADNVVSYEGKGVYANAEQSTVSVNVDDVTSKLDAVYAVSGGNTVTVTGGKIVSYEGKGVYATTPTGFVDVKVNGVTSLLDGITATSADGSSAYVKVTSTGTVESDTGKAIYATAHNGAVTVDIQNGGAVVGYGDAITARADNGAVSVTVAGNVGSYAGNGIDASSLNGAVGITVGSDAPGGQSSVTAKLDAIKAVAKTAAATVDVAGNVTSYDGSAVYATSDTAGVSIDVGGNVTSKLDAIYAESKSGLATDLVHVHVGSNLVSYSGKGIEAISVNGGVDVDVDGTTETKDDAITAKTTGSAENATVYVTTGGDITSYSGRGVVAEASNRSVEIDSTGAVTTELTGLYGRSSGSGLDASVTITQTGKLTSWKSAGIDALSTGGPVTITTSGGIDADLDAIVAESQGDDDIGTVNVKNTSGKIVSHKGSGIVATAAREGVTVTNNGDIEADQDGIRATSTGDTETSAVTIEQTGDITVAQGSGIHVVSLVDTGITLDGDITGGTYGINAMSLAGSIDASVADGSKVSGSSEAGVYLNSETSAKLTNYGDISSKWGLAFRFEGNGLGTVDNHGTISGDFAFAGYGAGTFNNLAGATYKAGTSMDFASGGTLNNAGLVTLSTDQIDSTVESSFLNGNYAQTSTGTLRTDIRFSDNWSDRLVVSGTAEFAGKVSVNVSEDMTGGDIIRDFKILTAAGGVDLGTVTLANPTLHGSIFEENGTDVILGIDGIEFAPDGLNKDFVPVTEYLDNVFDYGVPDGLKPLMAALLSIPDLSAYEDAVAQLTPEEYAQDVVNTYANNIGFANRMLSCRVADGPNRFKAEGDCNWFGARVAAVDQDAVRTMTAYNATFATLEAGGQRRVDANWRVGAALGITNAQTSAADGSRVQATQGQAGVVVKYDAGPMLLASALTGGYGVHETERTVTIGSVDETLKGSAPITYASLRLHGAYTFEMGAAYVKPLVNVDLTATHFGGVTETGGSTALTISSGTQYAATFNPAIEIGGEFATSTGELVRPFVQLGLEASVASNLDLSARFTSVDPSLGSFNIGQPGIEPVARVTIGADVLTQDKSTIRVYYDGSFGASSTKNAIGMKLSHTF